MVDTGEPRTRGDFGRRFVHGLFTKTTLFSILLCLVFSAAGSRGHWLFALLISLLVVWPFVALCDAGGKGDRARRNRLREAAREERWASGKRPLRGNSFRLTLVMFPLVALVFIAGGFLTGRHAKALAALPPCSAGRTSGCVRTQKGLITDRHTDGSVQTITVLLGGKSRDIELSDDGWGGRWRGHFPIAEVVTVQLHGNTPLAVTEPDGHHRKTDENPSDISGALWFMGWAFLATTLPIAFLLGRRQSRRGRVLRAWAADHPAVH